ncbi:STAS/SEC14 domain-containing protein [Nocardia nova]|uniref:STAS/SEC14 domain-containing protein n=1 Tax=Nocardia nova TaxID=37330 RepID=A0A2S6A0N0_9NOCA|nr:STAS/SEC14 domain-containing protein [Nocardia nova]PPJ24734.1 STAS/SEC14 domain-containing protein [Nocardia nova]
MIEILDDSDGNILGVRATGKLTRSDYRDVLAPRIRTSLERFPRLRVLFLIGNPFDGWTARGAWANTVLDISHRRDFEKIAMVGAPRWERWCVQAPAAVLMKGQLRTFRCDELADAWTWLRR